MLKGIYYNIDKINCIVEKKITNDNSLVNTKSSPRVIYKPIFYRAYDLQKIYMKQGLIQNVGINLADYMNKIESFRLSIEGNQISEFARNEVYVIFRIDTTLLKAAGGQYHILDNTGEYISSGDYEITGI
ncbi:MAG: hypothetical protein J1F35_05825 [Erysipelotrichales bacterium]|nr:hypothetical protein [Erysipelotrichales bacterium]